jgi:hypothetical protein
MNPQSFPVEKCPPQAPMAMGRSAPSAFAPNDWRIGWRVPGQAHCPRRDPPQPAAAVIPVPHCVSLRHRQCTTCGSRRSADGGFGYAPGSLHWYRARPSSSTRSWRSASPMLNRRLPRNAYFPPGTHDVSTHLVPPLHSLRTPLFSLRSGVSVLWALGTLQPLLPFCAPLPALHRPSPSPEQKIQPRSEFKARFFRITTEVGQSVMPKPILRVGSSSHIGDFTAHRWASPCIFR